MLSFIFHFLFIMILSKDIIISTRFLFLKNSHLPALHLLDFIRNILIVTWVFSYITLNYNTLSIYFSCMYVHVLCDVFMTWHLMCMYIMLLTTHFHFFSINHQSHHLTEPILKPFSSIRSNEVFQPTNHDPSLILFLPTNQSVSEPECCIRTRALCYVVSFHSVISMVT